MNNKLKMVRLVFENCKKILLLNIEKLIIYNILTECTSMYTN